MALDEGLFWDQVPHSENSDTYLSLQEHWKRRFIRILYVKSKIRGGVWIGLSNALVCQRRVVSSVSFSLFPSRCGSAQEPRLGLKSHYAGKKGPVITSYAERFFLVHLQSPKNIFSSTFCLSFHSQEIFAETYSIFSFPSLHPHTMEDVVLHPVFSHRCDLGWRIWAAAQDLFSVPLSHELEALCLCKFGSCAFPPRCLRCSYPDRQPFAVTAQSAQWARL